MPQCIHKNTEKLLNAIAQKYPGAPKPDYEAMRQQSREYEAELLAEMSETDKLKLMEINSVL